MYIHTRFLPYLVPSLPRSMLSSSYHVCWWQNIGRLQNGGPIVLGWSECIITHGHLTTWLDGDSIAKPCDTRGRYSRGSTRIHCTGPLPNTPSQSVSESASGRGLLIIEAGPIVGMCNAFVHHVVSTKYTRNHRQHKKITLGSCSPNRLVVLYSISCW